MNALLLTARQEARDLVAPVMAFLIPPRGQARLRLQPSAGHTDADIDLDLADEARRLGMIEI